jgi:hypothetical protein
MTFLFSVVGVYVTSRTLVPRNADVNPISKISLDISKYVCKQGLHNENTPYIGDPAKHRVDIGVSTEYDSRVRNTPTEGETVTERLAVRKRVEVELPHVLSIELDGKTIQRGDPIKIDNESGDWHFRYVYAPDGSIVCFGGKRGYERIIAFRPSRCHPKQAKRKTAPMTDERREALALQLAKARAARARS